MKTDMAELSLTEIEHRLIQAEKSIRELYSKYNGIDKNLVAVTTTLNSLLTLVGELKEAVEGLKNKPAALWDKLIFALLGAGISAIISYFTGG